MGVGWKNLTPSLRLVIHVPQEGIYSRIYNTTSYSEAGITLAVISTLSSNVVTSWLVINNIINDILDPDALIFSFRFGATAIGGVLGGGIDVVKDFHTGEWWYAPVFEFGLFPISIFLSQRGLVFSMTGGLVYDMSSVHQLEGGGLVAVWPTAALRLMPAAFFSAHKAWGVMSELAKKSKNLKLGNTISLGFSTSGPSYWQLGPRSNQFSFMVTETGKFQPLSELLNSTTAFGASLSTIKGFFDSVSRDSTRLEETISDALSALGG